MTSYQTELIEKLSAKNIQAQFNGDLLNLMKTTTNTTTGKKKRSKISFVFDDAAACQGARCLWNTGKGTWCEALAEWAAAIIQPHADSIAQLPVD